MNEYNESMEKRKRWILSIVIGCFLIIFFSQKINAQGMVLEFMDHYYHGIMTGFFPAVSKKEVTFSKYSIGHGPYVLSGNSTNLTISHRL